MTQRYDENLILGYLEGELSPPERTRFEAQLAEDEPLRQLVTAMLEDRALLRSLPQETPPAGLMQAVHERLERNMLLDNPAPEATLPIAHHRSRVNRVLVVTAMAALLMLVAGLVLQTWVFTIGMDKPGPMAHAPTPSAAPFATPAPAPGIAPGASHGTASAPGVEFKYRNMDQPPALAQSPVREEATLDRELDLDTPPRLALAGSSPSAGRPDRAAGEARESNAKLAGGSTITGSLSSRDDSNLAGDKRLPELAATPTEADPLFLKPSAPAPTRELGDLHQPVDSAKPDTAAAMATAPAAPSSPVIPSSTPAPAAALSEAGRVLPEAESAGNQIASAAGQDQSRNVGAARGLVNNLSQLQRVQVVTPDPRAAQAELQLWASLNSGTMNALPDSALQTTNAHELKSGPQTPREEQLYSQYRTPAQADVQLSRKLEQQTTNRQTFMVHLSLPPQQLQPMLVHLNQGRVGQNARLLDESSQLADSPEGSSRLRKQVELPTTMDQSPQDQFQRDQPKPPANEQEAIQVLIEFVEPEAQSP